VPDRRIHRGPHPDDDRLFAPGAQPVLRRAVDDYSWLLSRGYAQKSSLKLVGDRYSLVARQRVAVGRSACSDQDRLARHQRQCDAGVVAGRPLWLDGYNVLTTIEAALAGGVVLAARDGAYRDMASMHGSYRKVEETQPALDLLGRVLASLEAGPCTWYLDRPVSNSGRLKALIEQTAVGHGWPWRVELVPDPDALLSETDEIVATADSTILDRCRAWFNLARETVDREIPTAWVLDLGGPWSAAEGGEKR